AWARASGFPPAPAGGRGGPHRGIFPPAALLRGLGPDPGPAGLMARADPGAVVAVEVLVEEHEVAPVRVVLEFLGTAVDRPPPVTSAQKDAGQAAGQLGRDLPEIESVRRARRKRDLQGIAVEVMELLERLDQQVIHGEPDSAAPVRGAAEENPRRTGGVGDGAGDPSRPVEAVRD